jgi:hypothetical protein
VGEEGGEIMDKGKPYSNTDREIWREREGDYYSDSIHVTESGAIGINCGGKVVVAPLRKWFEVMWDNGVFTGGE